MYFLRSTVSEMNKIFDHPVFEGDSAQRCLSLHQGSHSVAEFSVEFRNVAAVSGSNIQALKGVFLKDLSEQLKEELATREEPANLDALISLASKIDNRLRERCRDGASCQSPLFIPPPPCQNQAPQHYPKALCPLLPLPLKTSPCSWTAPGCQ